MIYLDSAAVVKLAHFRALARYAPDAVSRLPAVLDQIELIDLDPPIRTLARTVRPAAVRNLDAAAAAGLPVDSPA
jgi:uncharacterized protein